MTYVKTLTNAELKGTATSDEVAWLHEHKTLWLCTLIQLSKETKNHIAESRLRLGPHKPTRGAPTAEYLSKKHDSDELTARRIRFLTVLDKKIFEVKVLLGKDAATPIVGDVVVTLLRIVDLIEEGNTNDARALAMRYAEKWK